MSEPAEIRVTNVRRVFHNGKHNAFTSLIRFRDRYYLSFRSCPDGHYAYPTSSLIILASDDAETWEQVHSFSVPKRDVRDGHFLVFEDKLFVYTGTWFCGDSSPDADRQRGHACEMNQQLGYGVVTEDGQTWSDPTMLEGTYGHFIWHATEHNGVAYMCGRRKREFVALEADDRSLHESAMLESDDGLVWRTRALFQTTHGNETSFLFEPDDSVLAVCRSKMSSSQLCRSKPPYTDWTRTDINRFIGGPMLVKWGERYLVGGRKGDYDEVPATVLSWLIDEQLHDVAVLPSAGDNSYSGFVELSPTRGVISWYSSHEQDAAGKAMTAIYLAELEISE
jgi:hypothetical protein